MKIELPDMNKRVKQLVDFYTDGNVSKFVRLLSKDGKPGVSQQKFNRIFNIDTRTKKYPGVPSDIITAITDAFKEVNEAWLLTGEGEMLHKNVGKPASGDRMNPMRAYVLALVDDYANWKAEEKGGDPKKIKTEIVRKANLILGGLDEWPFQDQES